MTSPYYQDSTITIYHADCMALLPELPDFDIVLADPPYGMSYQSKYRKIRHAKIVGDERLPIEAIRLCIEMSTRACYICCRWDNFRQMPPPKSVIAWVKNNWSAGDLAHEHGRMWEAVCFYPGMHHEFIKRIPDVIRCPRTLNALAPTQKPLALMETLIAANVGDTVLDPFMGSGTTLVAAKTCGRRSTGIDIDESNCEIAAKRFSELLPIVPAGGASKLPSLSLKEPPGGPSVFAVQEFDPQTQET